MSMFYVNVKDVKILETVEDIQENRFKRFVKSYWSHALMVTEIDFACVDHIVVV